ncbi:hypothetical protein GUJ93_ZPchr0006g42691 [Zizania palustris]|uniref:Uncharacterized protein n=1 Tax=Zizania palustris TaxID=103762 RepID=A0A8J5SAK4_ZIZPA|nr:hypothetical protein GUJ93_ZPchr0006g42691 [Zizania palustris]
MNPPAAGPHRPRRSVASSSSSLHHCSFQNPPCPLWLLVTPRVRPCPACFRLLPFIPSGVLSPVQSGYGDTSVYAPVECVIDNEVSVLSRVTMSIRNPSRSNSEENSKRAIAFP